MITEIIMCAVACDRDGCTETTATLGGEHAAWADVDAAEEDWTNGGGQSIAEHGTVTHLCPDHRRPTCADCGTTDGVRPWGGDDWCPTHLLDEMTERPHP